ncbi:MAG: hypothetical protein ACK4UN_11350, partial [Limisphaerales bacterium]
SRLWMPLNDLVYDSNSEKLYASVPGRAGVRGNTLWMIEPTNGVVTGSLEVGHEPGSFAKSDDGQSLYITINSNRSIRRVDLVSQTAGLQFALGRDSFNRDYYVEDMVVLPGNPESIAVSRQVPSGTLSGFTHEAVAIYDNGLPRQNTGKAPSHFYRDVIKFGSDASMIFAHNSGAVGFNRLLVNDDGVTFLDSDSALLGNFNTLKLEFAEAFLYSSGGHVVDPVVRVSVKKVPGITNSAAVLFDPPTRRMFYLEPAGANWRLLAFEADSLVPFGTMEVGGVSGTPSSLTR